MEDTKVGNKILGNKILILTIADPWAVVKRDKGSWDG